MFTTSRPFSTCDPVSPKVDICITHITAHSKCVPSRCGNHSSATTCESQTTVQRMKMINHTCSFAVQTPIAKTTKQQGSSLEPRMRTVLMPQQRKTLQQRLKNTSLKTSPARMSKYCAVQLRVPFRVSVLSNSAAPLLWMTGSRGMNGRLWPRS